MERKYILSAEKALMKLRRMSFEVLERNNKETELILAGIKGNGFAIAQILKSVLEEITPFKVSLILIDIDKKQPLHCSLQSEIDFQEPCSVAMKTVGKNQ